MIIVNYYESSSSQLFNERNSMVSALCCKCPVVASWTGCFNFASLSTMVACEAWGGLTIKTTTEINSNTIILWFDTLHFKPLHLSRKNVRRWENSLRYVTFCRRYCLLLQWSLDGVLRDNPKHWILLVVLCTLSQPAVTVDPICIH